MDEIIEDVKEKRFNTVEYPFGDESALKLVESLPLSLDTALERTEALTLDNLNVFLPCFRKVNC
jgi:hypothetical protein